MSEPDHVVRQRPRGRPTPISELTMIVKPPGRPAEIRVFAEADRIEAEQYAEKMGATVEPLG